MALAEKITIIATFCIIVVLALQPILKLPPQWNAKYLDLSSPILQVVPSILPFDHTCHMTIRSHDHSTTIAAIFDSGKKTSFCLNWVCSQKSGCHGYIISCMQLLVCEY